MTKTGLSQTENLLNLFRTHGNRLSTAFLSCDAVHGLIGTKYTGRISDLRMKGYRINDLGDQGHGNHVYELVEKISGGDNEGMAGQTARQSHSRHEAYEHERPDSPPVIFYDTKKKGQQVFAFGEL